MKNLIFLIILILAGIIGYMYFFGQGEDRARAESVVKETRELGKSVGDFIRRQKEKYDDGEFDNLMDRISKTLNKVRDKTSKTSEEEADELRELEKELRQIEPEKLSEENRARLKKLLEELEQEIDKTRQ